MAQPAGLKWLVSAIGRMIGWSADWIIIATRPMSSSPVGWAHRASLWPADAMTVDRDNGGPSTPGVGWAAGIERIAMMIEAPGSGKASIADPDRRGRRDRGA